MPLIADAGPITVYRVHGAGTSSALPVGVFTTDARIPATRIDALWRIKVGGATIPRYVAGTAHGKVIVDQGGQKLTPWIAGLPAGDVARHYLPQVVQYVSR